MVALYLVGLDREQIADVLGYRREAAEVAVRRALSRLADEQELTWARPGAEFVERLADDIRAARQPPRPRRWLWVAVAIAALLVAVPAFGALIAGDDNSVNNALTSRKTPMCGNLAEELNMAYARHEQAQTELARRQAQERKTSFAGLTARQRAVFEARQYREQEALLARQNRELRKLESRGESC